MVSSKPDIEPRILIPGLIFYDDAFLNVRQPEPGVLTLA